MRLGNLTRVRWLATAGGGPASADRRPVFQRSSQRRPAPVTCGFLAARAGC